MYFYMLDALSINPQSLSVHTVETMKLGGKTVEIYFVWH